MGKKWVLVMVLTALLSLPTVVFGAEVQVPDWVTKAKVKGDFRARYQNEDRTEDTNPHRDRGRIRLRLGVVTEVNDMWKVGFGLATGGDDSRSTNETLDDTFATPDIRLDYAYGLFSPAEWVKIIGGKFSNPIWKPADLLWDGDIRTDGVAIPFTLKVSKDVTLFLTPAYFILDEFKATTKDPGMLVGQAGIKATFNKSVYFVLAGTYYDFIHLKDNAFGFSAGSNTTSGGVLIYDYDSFGLGGEFGIYLPGPLAMIAVFGEYVSSDADEDNTGYLAGVKFGSKKVSKFLDWQIKAMYRYLERDAWPDFLPDSDCLGGSTNAKGTEVEIVFGLAKNVTVGVDWYQSRLVDVPAGVKDFVESLFQLDFVLKW